MIDDGDWEGDEDLQKVEEKLVIQLDTKALTADKLFPIEMFSGKLSRRWGGSRKNKRRRQTRRRRRPGQQR